jgi:hypothetical protein
MNNGIKVNSNKIYVSADKKTAEVVSVVCGRREDYDVNLEKCGYKDVYDFISERPILSKYKVIFN